MFSRRRFLKRSVGLSSAFAFLSKSYAQTLPTDLSPDLAISSEKYWRSVKSLFPMPMDEAYFNTGTMGAQPSVVLNKVIENMRWNAEAIATCDYQGNGPLLLSGYEVYPEVRKKIASLVGADFKEIALTQNATAGMNYISNGLDLKAGDEIVNTDQEHGGGRAGWQVAAKRYGLVYKQAKIEIPANDPQKIFDSIFKEVNAKTRVIAVPHISSVYGIVLPVREICAEARKRGIFTILDGAQTIGQIPVDVKEIGCDAYFSSLHKWLLAPAGNGVLYINKDSISDIWTTLASYAWENEDDPGYRLTQRGTGNHSLVVGLNAALDFHQQIGPDHVTGRIKELGDYLRAGLKEIPGVSIYSSVHPDMCAGITTYGIEGVSGKDLQNTMWKRKKLQPRAVGEHMIRHSVHIYNLKSEIAAALEIVKELAQS